MRKWISEKVPELVRKEVSAAVPAAMRAATHAGKELFEEVLGGVPYVSHKHSSYLHSHGQTMSRGRSQYRTTLCNAAGAESFVLIRSTGEPRKFLTLGAWQN